MSTELSAMLRASNEPGPAHLSRAATHPQVLISEGEHRAWVDSGIADDVRCLWQRGHATRFSCEGPGHRYIAVVGWIAEDKVHEYVDVLRWVHHVTWDSHHLLGPTTTFYGASRNRVYLDQLDAILLVGDHHG